MRYRNHCSVRILLLTGLLLALVAAARPAPAHAFTAAALARYLRGQPSEVAAAKTEAGYLKHLSKSAHVVVKYMEKSGWPGTRAQLHAQAILDARVSRVYDRFVLGESHLRSHLALLRTFVSSRPWDQGGEANALLLLYAAQGRTSDAVRAIQLAPAMLRIFFLHLRDHKFAKVVAGLVGGFRAAELAGPDKRGVPGLGWQVMHLGFIDLVEACRFQHVPNNILRAVYACYPAASRQYPIPEFRRGLGGWPNMRLVPKQTVLKLRAIAPEAEVAFLNVLVRQRDYRNLLKLAAALPGARPLIAAGARHEIAVLAADQAKLRALLPGHTTH